VNIWAKERIWDIKISQSKQWFDKESFRLEERRLECCGCRVVTKYIVTDMLIYNMKLAKL
jgi:hypothetical protein